MYLYDTRTKTLLEINPLKSRLGRLRRRVFSWAEGNKHLIDRYKYVMVTLTYRNINDWKPGHIRTFMIKLRNTYNILSYAWTAEMQKRGAVHYHVILAVPLNVKIKYPDREGGEWEYGMTKVEKCKSVYYICKYVGKEYQKEKLPKGARMFAVWIGQNVIDVINRYYFKISAAPRWLESILIGKIRKYKRTIGGYLVDEIYYRSPYKVLKRGIPLGI